MSLFSRLRGKSSSSKSAPEAAAGAAPAASSWSGRDEGAQQSLAIPPALLPGEVYGIGHLDDATLVLIFSKLPRKELFTGPQLVCTRWRRLLASPQPLLWGTLNLRLLLGPRFDESRVATALSLMSLPRYKGLTRLATPDFRFDKKFWTKVKTLAPALDFLDMSQNRLAMIDKILKDIIALFPGLTGLDLLACTKLTAEGWVALAQLPNLQKLTITHTEITDEAIIKIANTVNKSTKTAGFAKLTHLFMSACPNITPTGMCALTRNATNLCHLRAERCDIDDNALSVIAQACRHLELLRLRGARVTNKSILMLRQLTRLKHLYLRDTKNITSAGFVNVFPPGHPLRHLSLSGCSRIDGAVLPGLAPLDLVFLNLRDTAVNTAAFQSLTGPLFPRLYYLNLRGTPVEDPVLPVLGAFPVLHILVLTGAPVFRGPAAWQCLAHAFPHLTQLDLRANKIDKAQYRAGRQARPAVVIRRLLMPVRPKCERIPDAPDRPLVYENDAFMMTMASARANKEFVKRNSQIEEDDEGDDEGVPAGPVAASSSSS